ncbi:MAG: hypothetical protein ACI9MS_003785, partial [Glaciecola sp.]
YSGEPKQAQHTATFNLLSLNITILRRIKSYSHYNKCVFCLADPHIINLCFNPQTTKITGGIPKCNGL